MGDCVPFLQRVLTVLLIAQVLSHDREEVLRAFGLHRTWFLGLVVQEEPEMVVVMPRMLVLVTMSHA